MTGFLASVATLGEMEVARAGRADIIDLKNPARGALGAWDVAALQKAMMLWWSWPEPRPGLSATIGDIPLEPAAVREAVELAVSKGAPMIKIGMFPGGDPLASLEAVAPFAERTRLVAVFFGDQEPDFDLLPELAAFGFAGAMIDTADKSSGPLRRHIGDAELGEFVRRAKALGLLAGLAGSLKLGDVGPLAALSPDYLGFRGALCPGARTAMMNPGAVASVRGALDQASSRG